MLATPVCMAWRLCAGGVPPASLHWRGPCSTPRHFVFFFRTQCLLYCFTQCEDDEHAWLSAHGIIDKTKSFARVTSARATPRGGLCRCIIHRDSAFPDMVKHRLLESCGRMRACAIHAHQNAARVCAGANQCNASSHVRHMHVHVCACVCDSRIDVAMDPATTPYVCYTFFLTQVFIHMSTHVAC